MEPFERTDTKTYLKNPNFHYCWGKKFSPKNVLYLCKKVKRIHFRFFINMAVLFFILKTIVNLYLWSIFYFYMFYNTFSYAQLVFVFIFREIFILFTPILSFFFLFLLQKDFDIFHKPYFVVFLCYFGNI